MARGSIKSLLRLLLIASITFAWMAWPLQALATTIAQLSIEELYRASDRIGVVQILQGATLGRPDDGCGAQYTARIIQGVRQMKAGDTIQFGRFTGYEIGSYYLVFLADAGKEFNPLNSTNSDAISQMREQYRKCAGLWPPLRVVHSGNAAIEIVWYEEKWKSSRALKFHPGPIAIPEEGFSQSAKSGVPHKYPSYFDYIWVPLDDVLWQLSRITSKPGARDSKEYMQVPMPTN